MKKVAFTLAEVLITLGIVGVVAAMTLPNLVAHYREQQRVTQFKKTFAVLNNAYLMAVNDYGTPDEWGLTITNTGKKDENGDTIYDYTGTINIMTILMKYLRNSKVPNSTAMGYVKSLDGRQAFWPWKASKDRYFYLNDGTMFAIGWVSSTDCSGLYDGRKIACSDAWVLYPKKSPLTMGVDVFNITFTKEGFKVNPEFDTKCNSKTAVGTADQNGRGCSAWVIAHSNMEYLRCEGLSLNGQSKCSK